MKSVYSNILSLNNPRFTSSYKYIYRVWKVLVCCKVSDLRNFLFNVVLKEVRGEGGRRKERGKGKREGKE